MDIHISDRWWGLSTHDALLAIGLLSWECPAPTPDSGAGLAL
jgi:hypothetical protein